MKERKPWILVSLCIFILAVGIAGSVWALQPVQGNLVEIVQNGTVLKRLDLSSQNNQTIDVEYRARMNTISIERGRIRILHADCPDQTCVKMGFLDENSMPIVCLPNRLVIKFISVNENLDAVAR